MCSGHPKAGLLAIALESDVTEQGAVKQNDSRDSDKATDWAIRGSNSGWGEKVHSVWPLQWVPELFFRGKVGGALS